MKNNKGITLIALVVTIIVLLILAGVSIAMLSGDNGILGRGQEAKYKTEISSAEDVIGVSISEQVTLYMNKKYVDSTAAGETSLAAAIYQGVSKAANSLNVASIDTGSTASLSTDTTLKIHYTGAGTETDANVVKIIKVSYNGYNATGTISDSGILSWSATTANP